MENIELAYTQWLHARQIYVLLFKDIPYLFRKLVAICSLNIYEPASSMFLTLSRISKAYARDTGEPRDCHVG